VGVLRGVAWVVVAFSFAPFLYAAGVFLNGLPPVELVGVAFVFVGTFGLGLFYLWPHSAGETVVPIVFLALALFRLATAT